MPSAVPEPRAVVERVRPVVDCGCLPAKAAVGLPLEVSADIVADGHDLLMAEVRHGPALGRRSDAAGVPLANVGNDRWAGWLTPVAPGPYEFAITAMPDAYGTWLRDLRLRHQAGQDITVEREVGALLVEEARGRPRLPRADATALRRLRDAVRDRRAGADSVIATAGAADALALMRRNADWSRAAVAGPFPLVVERERATFSAWYEMFPRSEGSDGRRSGTLARAQRRLPAIAAMGFDVVYLPPIHPIGVTGRKGRNNALTAAQHDPGSPWAIGSAAGGHTAVHPDLGTLDDFDAFVDAAQRCGLEVALDFAIQCSPDHPWVREHPAWFAHRPDGSIRYAENPPKRYQDIYPIDFATSDRAALDQALLDVLLFWVDHGVRIFRVDNPHTKPLPFWAWIIPELRRRHPEVLLLSEAFTRPKLMQRLAKLGFTQSYTYFTWRNTKTELSEYLTELSQTELVDWLRPNFWVNTPDILHETLQRGGPAAFRMRAVLAALTCPSWGMYSGYELGENVPLRAGSEEYLDSEKYQYRPRDWDSAASLAAFITRLNDIRRRHEAAIAQLRTLRLHSIANEQLLCVSRMDHEHRDVLLVVVNLDPFSPQEATTWLDLEALGIPADRPFDAHDELTGATYVWWGPCNYVRLDPAEQPAHVLHLCPR